MNSNSLHYLNGNFVKDEDLVVPVGDLGFGRGFAVFDFLVTYNRRPFLLSNHVDRLINSAKGIGLEIPWSDKALENIVLQTLEKNESFDEMMIKIIISGGIGEMEQVGDPTIVVTCRIRKRNDESLYRKGVGIITVKHTRYLPLAKSNNYIEGVKQTKIAHKQGAFQSVYYSDSQVFEGSNTNIFAIIDGELLTPKTNILHGITREVVLNHLEVSAKERDFTLEELFGASEVFITGSNAEILPVISVDGKKIGDGKIGATTREVMRKFKEFTESDKW